MILQYSKLTVNVKNIIKVITLSKGLAPKCSFMYNNDTLEVVKEYGYLGIIYLDLVLFVKPRNTCVLNLRKLCMVLLKKINFMPFPLKFKQTYLTWLIYQLYYSLVKCVTKILMLSSRACTFNCFLSTFLT